MPPPGAWLVQQFGRLEQRAWSKAKTESQRNPSASLFKGDSIRCKFIEKSRLAAPVPWKMSLSRFIPVYAFVPLARGRRSNSHEKEGLKNLSSPRFSNLIRRTTSSGGVSWEFVGPVRRREHWLGQPQESRPRRLAACGAEAS